VNLNRTLRRQSKQTAEADTKFSERALLADGTFIAPWVDAIDVMFLGRDRWPALSCD